MAVFHGKAGTATFSGDSILHVTSWSLNVTADTAEATAMGDTYKSYTVGFKDSTATVTGYMDEAAGLDPTIVTELGASASLVLDTVTGMQYTVTAICTDIAMSVDATGNPTVTYSFQGNSGFDDTIVAEA